MAITRQTLFRYGSAVLAVILAAATRWVLDPFVPGTRFPLTTYFIALVFAAWYGGFGPSLVALALSLFLIPLVHEQVEGSWLYWTIPAQVGSWRYLLAGLAVAILGGSMGAAQRRARNEEIRSKQALESERTQRERLRVTLQSIADGIIVTDPGELVTSLNPVAERLTGWSMAEAVGRPLKQVFRTVDQATQKTAEMPVSEVLTVGVAHPMELTQLVPRGGRALAIEHGTSPIRDESGTITGVVIVFRDVTDRRRAEEALRESEERFSRFMQHLPGLAWIKDKEGRYIFANDSAEKAFRTRRADLYGRRDDEIFPPEAALQFKLNDQSALVSGKGVQVVETLQHADGVVHHSIVSKFPIPGSRGGTTLVGGIAIDITDLKRAEEALRQSEEQFRTLADSIPQLAWMARPDGHVFWYNRRWHEYTGLGPDELEHSGWEKVQDPAELPRVQAKYLAAIASGEPWEDTFPLRRHDGTMRWHLSRALPVRDERGQIVRWFGTNTDITDRREMEEALKDADRRKDEFLATLAHELRNPLAPIRNALYLMGHSTQNGQTFEPERAMAERQIVHLARLVDDLMDIARISRGKIELRKERVDLTVILRRAVESCRSLLEERGHTLRTTFPETPIAVEADPTRLEQIFWNLLNNAAKYTEPGGVIELAVERDEGAVVRVRDTGIGIEPAFVTRVFEMFVQAGHHAGRSQGGLGIGLSLVKNLVEMHGGTIEAHSAGLGRGSEFTVRLPEAPYAPAATPPEPAKRSVPSRAGRRILVVDDNLDAAGSLARLLTRLYGQQVRVANDGPSALEAVEAFEPEAILLDIGMPVMDGYEVARRLRQRPGSQSILLVALTGWGQETDREKSRAAGIDYHLVKPVDPDDLCRVLGHLDEPRG